MTHLTYQLHLGKLCAKYNLGQLTAEPEPVLGGLLHRMYRMQTDKTQYAVKALNPQIMQRKTAMDKFIFSEKVASTVCQNGINALPALVTNGSCIHVVDDQYYLLFPWVLGRILPTGTVDRKCCAIMGEILARIHHIDFSKLIAEKLSSQKKAGHSSVNWNGYASEGSQMGLEWSFLLADRLSDIQAWEQRVHSSESIVRSHRVISHRDLDQKNVLWDEHHAPIIIDWEAAGIINPTQEVLDVALYWSGFEAGSLSKDAFCTMISTYREHGGLLKDSWVDVLSYGFKGKLDWLAYNIRCSLGLESTDEHERVLGSLEAVQTLQILKKYAEWIPLGMEWLEEC